MQTWEYFTLKLETEFAFFSGTDFDTEDLNNKLNDLGSRGWELVSLESIEKVKGGSKFLIAVLKRPCR